MEESSLEKSVRERLVIAGLGELHEHGLADFSLRRVAISAQVSCAAPYRHFKDKNELIGAIVEYIASKWKLLCLEIEGAFGDDPERLVSELCISNLRFWLANGSFRTVLMTEGEQNPIFADRMKEFDSSIDFAIESYLSSKGLASDDISERLYAVRALIYGTVLLVTQGRARNDESTIATVRKKLAEQLR